MKKLNIKWMLSLIAAAVAMEEDSNRKTVGLVGSKSVISPLVTFSKESLATKKAAEGLTQLVSM